MRGLWYQLKLTARDKMCIVTFFLPLIMALALNALDGDALGAAGETRFAVPAGKPDSIVTTLEGWGAVAEYESDAALQSVIADPKDYTIGVIHDANGIRVVLAGDESSSVAALASRLEGMLSANAPADITVLPRESALAGMMDPLIALVLVMALFLGLTFNTMNLVAEKEDGIVFVNEVLPLSPRAYLLQKITIGFLGSVVQTMLSALICFELPADLLPLLPLTFLCGFVASVAGLLIGRAAENLMVSIVYMKVVMIVSMAVPMVAYMLASDWIQPYFHILPAYTFYVGVIGILQGAGDILLHCAIALTHCALWSGVYRILTSPRNSKV